MTLGTLLLGCSGSREAANVDDPRINVLVITATHGFRHGPAIDAINVMAAGLDPTEFKADVTEDLSDLNSKNLAGYDVLFFANSTLRVANDMPESEKKATDDPMMGDWGNWDMQLQGPNGNVLKGKVAIFGSPGNLTGNVKPEDAPSHTSLKSVELDGSKLTFSWDGENNEEYEIDVMIDGDAFAGVIKMGGAEIPIEGVRADADDDVASKASFVNAEQRAAIQEFVRSGKGVAVAHAGLDAFYDWDWYKEMVGGGLFKEHPWTQPVGITIEETNDPAVAHWGDEFEIHDEIYVLDNNPRWNSRVLASLDMQSVDVVQGPADPSQNDYPISWVRNHDGGHVFVTKLGHFPEVWQNEGFQQHIRQGLRMVAGRIPAKFSGRRIKEVIADNVWPDDIAVDEQGDVWIAELRGKIHHYDAETGEVRQLANMPTTDPTGIEHGIYGIEVDPNFYNGEPYVYIFYAEQNTFINTLSRFEYRNDQIDFSTEKVLLRVPTEPQCCHQAGDLEWGPDGTLYISTGDTGYSGTRPDWEISEDRIEAFKEKHDLKDYHWTRLVDSEQTSQNLTDPRGKILRINKDGSIPKDNPFYGQPGVRWDIYAYGLRNPYRFKVDDQTNDIYIGVVGPDGGHDYDEYNIVTEGGENFGWPRTIGTLFYNEWTPDMIPDYEPPAWEYDYSMGGRSATVGPIYRSNGEYAFPAFLQEKLFVFDWSRRWIKYVEVAEIPFKNDRERDVRNNPLEYETQANRFINIKQFDQLKLTNPISMELGPDGSLYVAEFDGFWDAGPNAKVTRYRWVED